MTTNEQNALAAFARLGLHGTSIRACKLFPSIGGVNVVVVGAPEAEVDAFVANAKHLGLPSSVRGVRKGARGTVVVHIDA